ncbi:glycerophosphodiester phosphodiesterase [Frankia sp. AgKG'84/4]|uniref:glycerophosphodiester phosphodiesterase n=1 Tax=Frankia sp. AgKG'84/4 TaxID=573490 RepID=UPI00200CF2F4|nr:glycerophosphodiester phosphodiesterase [Frankia sp. AgKG'84/4]MCL9793714.1 glycerophosphodiester phosphodiesterase [Frankia sp. AgKG'84/4]
MIGFAHRGAPAPHQRENCLPAFRRALAAGATGLESDAWLTADAVPVLHHDGIVGPPGRRRRITELPAERLPGWLPTLAAFYQELGTGFEFSLDLKGPAGGWERAADAVVAVASGAGGCAAVSRLWLCGNLPELAAYRARDPDVRLVNSTSVANVLAGGGIEAYGERLRAAGVAALNLRTREWRPQRADYATVLHDLGLAAFGWDAQRSGTLNRLAGYGLDAVYSDHLRRLVRVTGSAAT